MGKADENSFFARGGSLKGFLLNVFADREKWRRLIWREGGNLRRQRGFAAGDGGGAEDGKKRARGSLP